MTTHFVPWDQARPGQPSIAICGALVDRRDESLTPSCPDCQRLQRPDDPTVTGADVFGDPVAGEAVTSRDPTHLAGYGPRRRFHYRSDGRPYPNPTHADPIETELRHDPIPDGTPRRRRTDRDR